MLNYKVYRIIRDNSYENVCTHYVRYNLAVYELL